jgi:hypothetical protein
LIILHCTEKYSIPEIVQIYDLPVSIPKLLQQLSGFFIVSFGINVFMAVEIYQPKLGIILCQQLCAAFSVQQVNRLWNDHLYNNCYILAKKAKKLLINVTICIRIY